MNRAELVEMVAKATGQPKSEVTRTLSAFVHTITGALAKGDKVTLVGFGTFERRMRKARTGRNPRTLAPLKIAAARVPAFRAGSGPITASGAGKVAHSANSSFLLFSRIVIIQFTVAQRFTRAAGIART